MSLELKNTGLINVDGVPYTTLKIRLVPTVAAATALVVSPGMSDGEIVLIADRGFYRYDVSSTRVVDGLFTLLPDNGVGRLLVEPRALFNLIPGIDPDSIAPFQTESWYRVSGETVIPDGAYSWTEGGFDGLSPLVQVNTDGRHLHEGFLTLTPVNPSVSVNHGAVQIGFIGVYEMRGDYFKLFATGDYNVPLAVRWMWEWPRKPTALNPAFDDGAFTDDDLISHLKFDEEAGDHVFDHAPPHATHTAGRFAAMNVNLSFNSWALSDIPVWGPGGLVWDGAETSGRSASVLDSGQSPNGTQWDTILPSSRNTPWHLDGDYTVLIACTVDNRVDTLPHTVIQVGTNNAPIHQNTKWALYFLDGIVKAGYRNALGGDEIVSAPATIPNGEWHVFAIRKSGTTLELLRDAAVSLDAKTVAANVFQPDTANGAWIGLRGYAGTSGYLRVHGAALSNTALTAEALEIKTRVEARDAGISFPGFP